MRRSISRVSAAALGAMGLGLGVSVLAASGAWASNLPGGGTATLDQTGTTTPLATGTQLSSTTAFDVDLPSGAVCSLSGGAGGTYITFLVPAGTNLAALTDTDNSEAEAVGVLDQGAALATSGGFKPFDGAENTPAGGISSADITDFEMAFLISPSGLSVSGTQLPLPGTALIPSGQTSANYEAGLACFNNNTNAETDFWAVPVTFTAAASASNGFTWSIPGSTGPPVVPEAPLAVGLPVGGGLVLAGAVFINRRRRRTRTVAAA